MLRTVLKSKIHSATVTDANLLYEGSITIDANLLEAADIVEYERAQIVNLNNGSRVETYCMAGKRGKGTICMNGATARWAQPGDKVIIISYCSVDGNELLKHKPKVIFVDERNRIKKQDIEAKERAKRGNHRT